jgi:hypothetical protein
MYKDTAVTLVDGAVLARFSDIALPQFSVPPDRQHQGITSSHNSRTWGESPDLPAGFRQAGMPTPRAFQAAHGKLGQGKFSDRLTRASHRGLMGDAPAASERLSGEDHFSCQSNRKEASARG